MLTMIKFLPLVITDPANQAVTKQLIYSQNVARRLTGVGDIGERIFEMVSSERAVRGTPKRSTVAIYDQ
ncbi:MAG: hypothetical protein EZS28_031160 [Streblomastix strix]|uniref:Uncharacterized protein n=1 Tax=Streblomastix strix TaxID=222440 RepID=A0A5J4USI0_9EUKA|nr:MAG: hypothetical protein EZS28_031160 [Streblomastix strix]